MWYNGTILYKDVTSMPEMLDIVDENGLPTGQAVPRTVAHAEGLRHRTSHVWIVRKKNGAVQVLLQMRCAAKDSYPGCYDISSAGHIPAGAEFVGSALRELKEELGVTAATVSPELRHQQVRDLSKSLPCEAIVYGRLPLMITENCMTKNSVGCAHGAGSVLTDRTGAQFPVLCAYGCRCEIENGKVLVLADKPEVFRCGLRYGRLRFTTETAAECAALLRAHRAGTVTADDNSTRGLFYRGVE